MKICSYCGKQIDYNHTYCSESCEENTFLFYKNRRKFQLFFNIASIFCFIVIMLGTFIGLLTQELKYGLLFASPGGILIGIIYAVLPYYGLDEQIRYKGIVASKKTVRIIGSALAVLCTVCFVAGIIIPF